MIIKTFKNNKEVIQPSSPEKFIDSLMEIIPLEIPDLLRTGSTNLKKNNFDKALESYRKVLQLDSGNIDALKNMGLIYIKQNNFEKALEYYNQVLVLDPNNTIVKKIIKQLGFFIENTADNLDGNCNNENKVNLEPYTKFDKKIFDNSNYYNPDISEASYSVIDRKTEENDEELKKRMNAFYKLLENEKLKNEKLKNKKILEFPDDFIRKQMRDSLSTSSC